MMSDSDQKRRVTYRLYPTTRQAEMLGALLLRHQQLYNAALEERISAWQKASKSITYADQCASLTKLRNELPEWAESNCSSQQMTLRRLDQAYSAFFRRLKAGEAPGFPRFKSINRFPGFSFKSHGDGWKFTPGDRWRHGTLKISGVGHITCRGQARQGGRICASNIMHRDGQWFLSLSIEPEEIIRERVSHEVIALDWGVEVLLSGVSESGETTTIENPRLYQSSKERIAKLQRAVSRKKKGSNRRKVAAKVLRNAQGKQARRRLDSLHKISASVASQNALVAMEDLTVKNMTRSASGTVDKPGKNVTQKAGLNREILDTAPALLMKLLRYKVLETGGMWVEAPTKKIKPSQTCPSCGTQRKKTLSDRMHKCEACGHTEPRDIASARVVLNWALYGEPCKPDPGREPSQSTA